jgi:hypothetical protein
VRGRELSPSDRLAALARPADDVSRIAYDDRMRRHVGHHDGSGADHRAPPDAHWRDEHGSRAYRGAIFDDRRVPARRPRIRGAWTPHVGEGRTRSDEDVGAEDDAVPNASVTLDPRSRADDGATRNERERTDDDIGRKLRAVGDDRRLIDTRRGFFARSALHRPAENTLRLAPHARDD